MPTRRTALAKAYGGNSGCGHAVEELVDEFLFLFLVLGHGNVEHAHVVENARRLFLLFFGEGLPGHVQPLAPEPCHQAASRCCLHGGGAKARQLRHGHSRGGKELFARGAAFHSCRGHGLIFSLCAWSGDRAGICPTARPAVRSAGRAAQKDKGHAFLTAKFRGSLPRSKNLPFADRPKHFGRSFFICYTSLWLM